MSHWSDLADRSFQRNIYTYTNFLNLSEVDLLYRSRKEFRGVTLETYGGREGCERVVARFGSPEQCGYEEAYPITALSIEALNVRFAEELSHRDVLGAVMQLGIEREMIGDIVVQEKNIVLFCISTIAEYISKELTRIRHTSVTCRAISLQDIDETAVQKYQEIVIAVASERIDAVCAALTKQSRSQVLELFRTGKIFINSRTCENNSTTIHAGDILTIRGCGKFLYEGVGYTGRKGKLHLTVKKYS